ncbi:hypothetical protein JD844_025591 [Phrynosoma platyrhinos]|uniref:Uncharacterized protein n=1 Tax=Phrynosoma platyrhinos TaxID=52577 RepID=A0ABQ7SZZ5_PHRPL|nr:hypothetical protein JD844_025591 [Phrynosoma platyrhinos]
MAKLPGSDDSCRLAHVEGARFGMMANYISGHNDSLALLLLYCRLKLSRNGLDLMEKIQTSVGVVKCSKRKKR